MMTTVKVLGAGCTKCKTLHQRLLDLKAAQGLEFELVKVTDLQEIISHGVMSTPGLVVNGVVKSAGAVPNDNQLLQWLKEADNAH
jgi:small redox-active disulfide protein 2